MNSQHSLSILVPAPSGEETRVGATPETVATLTEHGFTVAVESGAAARAWFSDEDYRSSGAQIVDDGSWSGYDVVLTVSPWDEDGRPAGTPDRGSLVVGFLDPHRHTDALRIWASDGVTAAAMELVPRITRAQSMDALSSQASVAGYRAVILAAGALPQYFPLLMTAAGTVTPARVVIMGGGVAGLQAVATARRLGAVVEVSDIREAVREQVESLGGRFIDLPEIEAEGEGTGGYASEMTPEFLAEQRRIVAERVAAADVVICTAQVPGRRAPMLVSRDMVESMAAGGVIVDLAAAQGGNCELTRPDETVLHDGIRILGPTNLAAGLARDASRLYARNLVDLLIHMTGDECSRPLALDLDDEITGQVVVTHRGRIVRTDIVGDLGEEE